MWHVRIDSQPWGPEPTLAQFDDTLLSLGSQIVDLTFSGLPLEDDEEHFTRTAQGAFNARFASALRAATTATRVLVLADSTIDFHNWSCDGEWTGWATSSLEAALVGKGMHGALVDAVCGSGFVAGASRGEHFYARLSHHLRGGHCGPVVFVGGWNDANLHRVEDVLSAMRKCASVVDRYNAHC